MREDSVVICWTMGLFLSNMVVMLARKIGREHGHHCRQNGWSYFCIVQIFSSHPIMMRQGLLKWVQRQRFKLTETAERILHVAHIDVSLTLDESLDKRDAE